jgi:hypothetical protein
MWLCDAVKTRARVDRELQSDRLRHGGVRSPGLDDGTVVNPGRMDLS